MVPQNHRGTANSTMLMAGDLGVGLGTLLWGISIQFCGFHVSIALSGLAVILSGVLSLLSTVVVSPDCVLSRP